MSPDRNDFHTQLEERADERRFRGSLSPYARSDLSYYNHNGCTVACPSLLTAIQRGPCFVRSQRETPLTGLGPDSILTR